MSEKVLDLTQDEYDEVWECVTFMFRGVNEGFLTSSDPDIASKLLALASKMGEHVAIDDDNVRINILGFSYERKDS